MKLVFRTDASFAIGTGHVMRCLTLATALQQAGAEVAFICRELSGNLIDHIRTHEISVTVLPATGKSAPAGPPEHSAWAAVGWERDAKEAKSILKKLNPDWLIVDHYAFDARWEKAVRQGEMRLMVIDDLADRPHDCDLLLDQNIGRKAADYEGLVSEHCKILVGPRYALLRAEFAAQRSESLLRRKEGRLEHILVSMGGIDAHDATSIVLEALCGASLPGNVRLTVIVGSKAPAREQVKARARIMPWPTALAVDVSDMAARMVTADLAIGAAGSTTWERCCLGLPSLIVETADNQAGIARAMAVADAALDPGPLHAIDFVQSLRSVLAQALEPARLQTLGHNAAKICDGGGAPRVTVMLLKTEKFNREISEV